MQRKTKLALAVGAALFAVGGAVQAQTQTVAPGQPVTVQLYGQVNRALMFADDGVQSKIFHVDGQPSSTRIGVRGTSEIMPGLRAGAQFEAEFRSNQGSVVSMASPSVAAAFTERWFDIFVEGGWGKVNIGQGSGAADDASTIDLSGTGLANGKCICDWGGGLVWRQPSGLPVPNVAGATAPSTVQSVLNDYDFESRYDRLMYTTPTFAGFRAQAGFGYKSPPSGVPGTTGASDVKEASVWYSGKIAGTLQAALGWSEEDRPGTLVGGDKNETIGGSVSWLSAAGFNVTLAYTEAKNFVSTSAAEPDLFLGKAKSTWGKVGYKFGKHAVALSYALVEDSAAAGDEGTSIGLGYTWAPVAWAEFYASYIMHSLDRTGVSVEDIKVAVLGTRIRF